MAKEYIASARQIADAIELEASCLLDEGSRSLGEHQPVGEDMAKILNQAALIMRLFGTEYELTE